MTIEEKREIATSFFQAWELFRGANPPTPDAIGPRSWDNSRFAILTKDVVDISGTRKSVGDWYHVFVDDNGQVTLEDYGER